MLHTISRFALPVLVLLPVGARAQAQLFRPVVHTPIEAQVIAAAAGDLDADGRPDLVLVDGGFQTGALLVLRGDGAGGFSTPTRITGVVPRSVALADLNGDGKLDAVVESSTAPRVRVLLGDGAGGFTPGPIPPIAGGAVTIVDLDGDHRPDLAVAAGQVAWYRNNGLGVFTPAGSFPAGDSAGAVYFADLNHDGRLDFVAIHSNTGGSWPSIALGNGVASFGPPTNVPDRLTDLDLADVDVDGTLDFVCSDYERASISVLFGDGAGGIRARSQFPASLHCHSVTIGDVNGDGRPDVVLTHGSGATPGLEVLVGQPGGFAPPAVLPVVSTALSPMLTDLDGDGRMDLVCLNQFNPSGISVFLGLPTWLAAAQAAVGSQPQSVARADFNRDGRPDLVTANTGSNNVSVLLGNGAGGFAIASSFAAGLRPDSVAVGDLDRDGRLDLVCTNESGNTVTVLRGTGTFGFTPAVAFPVPSTPRAAALADVNGDGRLDVVVALRSTNSIAVLLGNGAGGLGAATTFPAGTAPQHLIVSDVDRDGRADVVTANLVGDSASLLRGNGLGGFAPPAAFAAGVNPMTVALADLDADGRDDLVVADLGAPTVSVLRGNATRTFDPPQSFDIGFPASFVAVGDVTGDGRLDVVATYSGVFFTSGKLVQVLPGDGTGRLVRGTTIVVGDNPVSVALGDLNGDGRPDLATANAGASSVSVLLNQGLVQFGTGTPGCAGMLSMSAALPPRINSPGFALGCLAAPHRSAGILFLADAADVSGSDPLGLGVTFHVGAASAFLLALPVASDPTGSCRIPVPIPAGSALLGGGMVAQTLWFEDTGDGLACSRAVFHLVSSRGLALRFLP
jgi:hypothetical protein